MAYQEEIVQECFSGQRERECTHCPAHYTKGGVCCFGEKHDWNDDDCKNCIHQEPCSKLTHRPKPVARTVYRRPVHAASPTTTTSSTVQSTARRVGSILQTPTQVGAEPLKYPDDATFTHKLATTVGWGMIEGGLEFALHFFRRRRPE